MYEWEFTPDDLDNYESRGGAVTLWVKSTGGVLDPKGLATRAQAAQMLKNFFDK